MRGIRASVEVVADMAEQGTGVLGSRDWVEAKERGGGTWTCRVGWRSFFLVF
jgi:hypothetical protein